MNNSTVLRCGSFSEKKMKEGTLVEPISAVIVHFVIKA